MSGLDANKDVLGDEKYEFCKNLSENFGQQHLFEFWPAQGADDDKKVKFVDQLKALDGNYPGGLESYITNAKDLLQKSKDGVNPFEGYVPQVPTGEVVPLTPFSDEKMNKFVENEELGFNQVPGMCFVIVAGGLGERLGYSGIKLALPTDVMTETSFLDLYAQNILALQAKFNTERSQNVLIPLAIMTSGDTHDRTVDLLKEKNNFGLKEEQVHLIKQEKVPALLDNDAKIAVDEDEFEVKTKPHGHGDVHSLLYSSGLAKAWLEGGKKYVIFLQDTNVLVFRGLLCSIGVSEKLDLAMNSLTVPRNDGEAVGAICKLVNESEKKELTVSVEYNQLESLLSSTDVTFPKQEGNEKASPFPGNINVLILELNAYSVALDCTKGAVPEFVNPKYANEEKTEFKKPTRLECMMQDFSRLLIDKDVEKALGKTANVGFTQLDRFTCFSAAKNNLKDAAVKEEKTGFAESMASCERHNYDYCAIVLEMLGAEIEKVDGKYPRILMMPSFAVGLKDIKERFKEPKNVKISARSSLVLEGNVQISSLFLDGHLELHASEKGSIEIRNLRIENEGSELKPLKEEEFSSVDEALAIRGFTLEVAEEVTKIVSTEGKAIYDEKTSKV